MDLDNKEFIEWVYKNQEKENKRNIEEIPLDDLVKLYIVWDTDINQEKERQDIINNIK